jgi:predicted transposase YdaD
MTSRPHDALFKSAFEAPAAAAALLRELLPVVLRELIAWDTLHGEPASFVDPALADLHSDLLYAAQLRTDPPARLHVLLEHQSTYLFRMIDPMHRAELRAKIRLLGPRAEETAMTIAEQLREEGREEGRIVALRAVLLARFGSHALDAPHDARLRAATAATIDRYLERVGVAESLDAVFED